MALNPNHSIIAKDITTGKNVIIPAATFTSGLDVHSGQDTILTGETLTIETRKQSTITGTLTIEGTGRLVINGRLNTL